MSKQDLRIIFFGSAQISVEILSTLLKAGYIPSCVVTQPDKKSGRHLMLHSTPVKIFAETKALDVLAVDDLSDKAFLDKLAGLEADIFIVVAYGKILPAKILDIPRSFALNIHTSLLPKYRGAAPIQWAIINGETSSGITIIRMNEKIDEGDIVAQEEILLEADDNAITLEAKLSVLAGKKILEVLDLIKEKKITFSKQDSSCATFAPKLEKNDGVINWNIDAVAIHHQIRGCLPWPVAFTYFKGKRLKIFAAKVFPESVSAKPGEVVSLSDGLISVACAHGVLKIEEVQPENSRRMRPEEFIAGSRISLGDFLG
ncbi:MAG: methionyl-tRNA formyltransferase [Candidatus Omnitrophica bacterium]|nr:methionyl-tRNA formyltransferase [Candidatus Omnitrophota bacterium]